MFCALYKCFVFNICLFHLDDVYHFESDEYLSEDDSTSDSDNEPLARKLCRVDEGQGNYYTGLCTIHSSICFDLYN